MYARLPATAPALSAKEYQSVAGTMPDKSTARAVIETLSQEAFKLLHLSKNEEIRGKGE